jgi:hypothetical protein
LARSDAATVSEYLAGLPPERREVMQAVREVILENLPAGYRETMNWGMACYELPLERYPDTYNRQPLAVVALAAQKGSYSFYLSCFQDEDELRRRREALAAAGTGLDLGMSCIRFKRATDLPLQALGEIIAGTTPEVLIGCYQRARARGHGQG